MLDAVLWAAAAWALVVVLAYLLRRREMCQIDPSFSEPLPPTLGVDGVQGFIAARDDREGPLKPGTGSEVRWAPDQQGSQAKLCVVFLHGWSASPEEICPVDAEVAASLGAHLLRFRLTGHGLEGLERCGSAMRDKASSRALRTDAATAFALGSLLGKRVVIIGCSTGGRRAVGLLAALIAQWPSVPSGVL